MNEHLIDIPGRLHSVAVEEHVAGTDQIYDDLLKTTLDILNLENITDVKVQDGKLLFLNIQGLVLKEISTFAIQKQSDWNLTDSTQVDFIKGKPTVYNKLEVDDKLLTKQDTISDLAAIRSGAQAGATAYQKPGTGIPATDLSSDVQSVLAAIVGISEVIPAQASSDNKLADKNFVNSSIATNTANYISDNGQPFQSVEDLEAYSGVLTNNDYAFVVGVDSAGNTTYSRYKYNASTQQWALEYVLNNSSFTAEQWAAINSSITRVLVNKLSALPTNSELTALLNGKASKEQLEEVVKKAYMDANNSEIITDSDNMKHFILSGAGTLVDSGLYTTSRYAYFDTNTHTIGGIVYEKTIQLSGFSSYPTFYIHCPFGGQLHLSMLTDDYARFTIVGHHINEQYESSFVGTIEVDAGEDISITHNGREKRIWIGEIKLTYKDYLERTTTITLLNSKVDKVAGKGLSTNDYTDNDKGKLNDLPTATELAQELGGKANTADLAEVATSGSYNDLSNKPDLSGFITNSVNNLVNYYLKSETYTKTEVEQLVGALQNFHYEIYPALPQTGVSNVLYLIGPIGSGSVMYEQYVYANNDFTKIGDTSIDLSGYVTTTALNTALADYVTSSALSVTLANYYNKNDVDVLLANTVAESGVYDVTANNNNAKFASLSALLSSENLDNLIPSAKRKGGMSIKFVLSSDNNYVQARCMAQNFTTDVTQWQGVDDVPTSGSNNLVKSGGVYNAANNLEEILLTPIVPKTTLALKTDGTLEIRNCRIAMISLTEIEGHIIKFDKPSGAPHFSGFYDYAFLDYNLGIISGAAYGGNSHFEIEIPQGASAFIYLVGNWDASYDDVTVIGKRIPSNNYNLITKYEAFNVYNINGFVPCYFNITNNTISTAYARTGMLKISVPSGAKFVSFPVLPSFVAVSTNYKTNFSPCAVFLDKNCDVIKYYGRLLGFGGRMEVEIPQGTDCMCITYLTNGQCQSLSSVGIDVQTFSQVGGVQFLTDEDILDKDVKDACDMLAITKDNSNIFPSEYSEEFIHKYLNTNTAKLINTQEHFDYPSVISNGPYNTAVSIKTTFFELYENDVECIIYELYANSEGTVDIGMRITGNVSITQRISVTQGYNKVICYRRRYNNTNERVWNISLGSTSNLDEIGRVYIGRCNGDFSVITPENKNKSFVSTNSDLFEKIQSSYKWLTNLTPQEDVIAINRLASYTGLSGQIILNLKPIRFDCTRYGLIVKTRGTKTAWVITGAGADDNISVLINGLITGENQPQYTQYTAYKTLDNNVIESTTIILFDNDAEYLHNLRIQRNLGTGNFDIIELSVVPLPSYITKPLQLVNMLSIERGDRLAINSLHSTYSDSTGAFNKKKFVMVGDSIASQSTYTPEIIKHTGMSYYKKIAAGGAHVRPTGDGNCIYWFVDDIPSDADFIMFIAGQNDIGLNMSVPSNLGTIDDAPYISTDPSDDVAGVATFYAAFKGMLVKTIQKCPKAKIVVCGLLPTWTLTAEGMEAYTAKKIVKSDIIKSICELYGIQFIDLIRKSGINWYNACWMFTHDGAGTDIWPDGTAGGPTSDSDGQVHPSPEGGKKCAEVILSEII